MDSYRPVLAATVVAHAIAKAITDTRHGPAERNTQFHAGDGCSSALRQFSGFLLVCYRPLAAGWSGGDTARQRTGRGPKRCARTRIDPLKALLLTKPLRACRPHSTAANGR